LYQARNPEYQRAYRARKRQEAEGASKTQ
jgi:hypothetical protein